MVVAMDEMRKLSITTARMYMDNARALAMTLRGRAHTGLLEQQRILRSMTHQLRWQSCKMHIAYVPSELNPADPISRWWQGHVVCEGHGCAGAGTASVLRAHSAITAVGVYRGPGPPGVGRVPVGRLMPRRPSFDGHYTRQVHSCHACLAPAAVPLLCMSVLSCVHRRSSSSATCR